MTRELSIAHRVREYVRSLKPGDQLTTESVAAAIGFVGKVYKSRKALDYGPISGPLHECRVSGAIKIIAFGRSYTYEVVDVSLMPDIGATSARMSEDRTGSGEGCARPARTGLPEDEKPELTKLEPTMFAVIASGSEATVHEAKNGNGNGAYVKLKIDVSRVLSSLSSDALMTELRRRIRGERDDTTKI